MAKKQDLIHQRLSFSPCLYFLGGQFQRVIHMIPNGLETDEQFCQIDSSQESMNVRGNYPRTVLYNEFWYNESYVFQILCVWGRSTETEAFFDGG